MTLPPMWTKATPASQSALAESAACLFNEKISLCVVFHALSFGRVCSHPPFFWACLLSPSPKRAFLVLGGMWCACTHLPQRKHFLVFLVGIHSSTPMNASPGLSSCSFCTHLPQIPGPYDSKLHIPPTIVS